MTDDGYTELILDALLSDPGRTVLTESDGTPVRALALHDSVHAVAMELSGRGVRRGATVSLLADNRSDALVARYAANLLGARVVFLYEGMAAETLALIAESVETTLLLVESRNERLRKTGEEVLARMGATASTTFVDLARAVPRHAGRRVTGSARPEDDWCIRHTGGTTGVPKGVRMAHGPYRQSLSLRAGTGEPSRLLVCTPLAHLAGIMTDMTLRSGGHVVLQPSFDAGEVLAAVERERITDLWLLPPLLHRLLDHPRLAETDVSSLRRITYGGCPASPERLREAAAVFGPVLYGAYGQAEAGWICEAGPEDLALTGPGGQVTVGRAGHGVEIAVRDPAGRRLGPGETGEITVRTPLAMSGYWKQPERTAEVLRDGWVWTGDAGCLDEEGHLFLVDRLKDMIIVVGGHVYPSEVENLLLTHPAVAHCAVFGAPGLDGEEEVRAAVVPAPGQTVTLEELREFVTEHKGAMYAPRALRLIDRVPLTDAGKPDKKLLRTLTGGEPLPAARKSGGRTAAGPVG